MPTQIYTIMLTASIDVFRRNLWSDKHVIVWCVRIGVLYILPFIFFQSHQSQLLKCVLGEFWYNVNLLAGCEYEATDMVIKYILC